jgi:hypothetical protein
MAPVMTDLLFSFSAHLAIVATLVVVLKLLGKITIHWQWVALSLALYIAYFAALITGIPLEPVFGPGIFDYRAVRICFLMDSRAHRKFGVADLDP